MWRFGVQTTFERQAMPVQAGGLLNNIHLLGYCPEADVIADACLFQLSDKTRVITEHIMPVSGGAGVQEGDAALRGV